jgi:hypothetical protein
MADIDSVVARFKKELEEEAETDRIEEERKTARAAGEQWAATKASYKLLRALAHWNSGICLPRQGPTTYREIIHAQQNIVSLLTTLCPNKPPAYRQGFIEGALEVYEQARAIIGREES